MTTRYLNNHVLHIIDSDVIIILNNLKFLIINLFFNLETLLLFILLQSTLMCTQAIASTFHISFSIEIVIKRIIITKQLTDTKSNITIQWFLRI